MPPRTPALPAPEPGCATAADAPPGPIDALDAALEAERDLLRTLFPLPPARKPQRSGRTAPRRTTAIALVLAAAAALLWADPAWRTEHHATAIGERKDVRLADGSLLTLDTATALDVRWHLRSRRVSLQQGQARFAVAPSRLRPFEVAAGDADILATGTVFDVLRLPALVQVTLLQGRVEVSSTSNASAPQRMAQGQQVRVRQGRVSAPEPVDPAQADAWQQGRLVFDRTPLRDALAEVQRHRATAIRLQDDGGLGEHAVSGVFEADRTDQLLDLLARIAPARVERQADGSVDIMSRERPR